MNTLNIGLSVGDRLNVLDAGDVARRVAQYAHVIDWQARESGTEMTAVIVTSRPLTPAELYDLSLDFGQDCVAQRTADGVGSLVGPRAAAWLPFNPEFFIEFDPVAFA